jgi:hypothetical protein
MNELFWSWLTGFYESEGSCGCYTNGRKGNKHRLMVSLAQKDRRVLDYIKDTVERGTIAKNKTTYGVIHAWRLCSADARWFLKQIRPYMRTPLKIDQVDAALAKDAELVGPRHTRRDPTTGRLIGREKCQTSN